MNNRDKWFTHQTFFLRLVGMMPLRLPFLTQRLRFIEKLISLFFYVFWHFVVFHLAFVQLTTIYQNLDKTLDDITDYAMIGSIYTYGYWILCFFQYNDKKLSKLTDYVVKYFRLRSAKGLTYISNDDCVRRSKRVCNFWVISCLCGTLSWIFYPLFQCATCKILPLKSWYPVDVTFSPSYEVAFVLQLVGQIFVGVGYGMCGGVFINLVFMVCGQYDMLYASLKNLSQIKILTDKIEFSERQAKYKTDVQELNQYLVSDEKLDTPEDYPSELSLEDGLKDCVKHHEMIQVFNESLEDYFRWFLISKFCFSTFLVCILAYVVSSMEEFSMIRLGNLLTYFVLATGELLLFGYISEIFKHHSARAGESMMRSDWETFDITTQKSMVMIMASGVKPIQLTAGKIFKVNVEYFRSVMGTAFSYYTLLKKLKEKNSKN